MSDDELFWPPLSGDGHADDERTTEPLDPTNPATQPMPPGEGEPPAPPRTPAGRRRSGIAVVVGVTAFVFGAGGVGVGAAIFNGNGNSVTTSLASSPTTTVSPSALTTNPKTYAGIAAKLLPSVVSINVTSPNESDTGSGVVLQSNGYILTNNHVVAAAANGAGSTSVTFNDGSTASAKIVGTDSLDDLAVIKVAKSGLTPASLGDSSALQVGDPVVAIGSPLGLTGTVTSGIVSALNRPVQTQDESQQQQLDPFGGGGSTKAANPTVIEAIQTDAAINPGNSGGALVDAAGQVVGINSAIATAGGSALGDTQSGNIGVGFAIPINQAKTIAGELIRTGHATHPLLGVSLTQQTTNAGIERAIVHSVTTGGPASKAGIKDGDVITGIDGLRTEGADAVIAAVRSHQPGQRVTVTYERGGSSHTVTATLATESASQAG
jgi:putative serine protease PepD